MPRRISVCLPNAVSKYATAARQSHAISSRRGRGARRNITNLTWRRAPCCDAHLGHSCPCGNESDLPSLILCCWNKKDSGSSSFHPDTKTANKCEAASCRKAGGGTGACQYKR
ncbi:hypothetical protein E2C01_057948 [Portunus trituberculatus]|uniref:Uncharacterized protein n=1 Tax=Portunus trituberculatus TaxID=210409 RepID=A0A5B7GYC6_PORTR|nr:hypothetical protein [Portunus trituberculatus]